MGKETEDNKERRYLVALLYCTENTQQNQQTAPGTGTWGDQKFFYATSQKCYMKT
uniref:Uncharacterized protein n=1 Tax=Arion vulgaris TaxID=1028688 RepID=A0A0B6ZAM3_9EUPU